MTFFVLLFAFLSFPAKAELSCQLSFDDDLNPRILTDIKAEAESKPDSHKRPNPEAAKRGSEIAQVLKEYNFDSPTVKEWALNLAREIEGKNSNISQMDTVSYAIRMATLLSIKDAPGKYEIQRRHFETKDFENLNALVNKLETINLNHLRVPIYKAFDLMRNADNLPNGYVLYATFLKTPIRVMNTMAGTGSWILGLATEVRVQHGIPMSPLAYLVHDMLHFKYFIENNSNVSLAQLIRLREKQEAFLSTLKEKDQELFETSYFYWWFEKSGEVTNLENFFKEREHGTAESRKAYMDQLTRSFSWSIELPTTWSSPEITRSAQLIREFQESLFKEF